MRVLRGFEWPICLGRSTHSPDNNISMTIAANPRTHQIESLKRLSSNILAKCVILDFANTLEKNLINNPKTFPVSININVNVSFPAQRSYVIVQLVKRISNK